MNTSLLAFFSSFLPLSAALWIAGNWSVITGGATAYEVATFAPADLSAAGISGCHVGVGVNTVYTAAGTITLMAILDSARPGRNLLIMQVNTGNTVGIYATNNPFIIKIPILG